MFPPQVVAYMSYASSLLCPCKKKKKIWGRCGSWSLEFANDVWFPGLSKSKSYLGSEGGKKTQIVCSWHSS